MKKIYKKFYFLILFLFGIIFTQGKVFATGFENTSFAEIVKEKAYSYMLQESLNKQFSELALTAADDGWELGLVMYDSFVNDGKTAITSGQYNPTNRDESSLTLVVQVNYRNTKMDKTYAPGEISITVPSLQKFGHPNHSPNSPSAIGADASYTKDKKFNWSYSSNSGDIVFTNNYELEKDANLEGSIQMTYLITPYSNDDVCSGTTYTAKATLTTGSTTVESDSINYSFNAKKAQIEVTARTQDPLYSSKCSNEYIYVPYIISNGIKRNSGVRELIHYNNGVHYEPVLQSGCILYDANLNPISRVEAGNSYSTSGYCVIAYPKSIYSTRSITQKFDCFGPYEDCSFDRDFTADEIENVGQASVTVNLADFDFVYTGSKVAIENYNSETTRGKEEKDALMDYDMIINNGGSTEFKLYPTFLGEDNVNVQVGNDYIVGQTQGGEYDILNEDEYYIKSVYIGTVLHNSIKTEYAPDTIPIKVYVKYRGTNEFVKYQEFMNTESYGNTVTFTENNVIAFYVEYQNLTNGLNGDNLVNPTIIVNKKDIAMDSKIYDFGWIRAYDQRGTLLNVVDLDTYQGMNKEYGIPDKDKEIYGTYMQRDVANCVVQSTLLTASTYPSITSQLTDNPLEEKYYGTLSIDNRFGNIVYDKGTDTKYPSNFSGFKHYTVIPKGLNIEGVLRPISEEEARKSPDWPNNLNLVLEYIRYDKEAEKTKHNGECFSSSGEFVDYIYDHTSYEIKKNYDGRGNSLLITTVDFTDAPLDFSEWAEGGMYEGIPDYTFNISVSYDSYLQYGDRYSVTNYLFPNGNSNINGPVDTGDYDLDGDRTEKYFDDDTAECTIVAAASSQQDVKKTVETDRITDFKTGFAEATAGSEYRYKLRVRTGQNGITNLVIYDNVEKTDKGSNWKGEFLGVDTSYAQSQGYNVKVYYSEQENAGNLASGGWQDYNDGVDKTKVKSLAFEYYKGGSKATIPSNSTVYVIVNMRATSSNTKNCAYNSCWTEWNALTDEGSIIDGIVGINSNEVSVGIHTDLIESSVTAKYVDKYTGQEIESRETYNGYVGEDYSTVQKTIPGYTFVNVGGDPPSGQYEEEPKEVTYYYAKDVKLTVRHLYIGNGKPLTSDTVTKYKQGDSYTTSSRSFEGYKLVQTPSNARGTMGATDVTVTYYYDLIRVNINIGKTLEATDSTSVQDLSGAKFKVSSTYFSDLIKIADPDTEYYSTVTASDGSCIIEGVPFGRYDLNEITIPDIAYAGKFKLNGEGQVLDNLNITIDQDKSYTYDLEDVAKKMQIKIYKEDIETGTTTQGDAHLEGAEYTFYRDQACTDAVETVTIEKQEDGTYTATSGWYLVGTYYVKETKPPVGYLIDETVYTVTQNAAEQTEEKSYHEITSKELVIKNDIEIVKNLEKTDSTPKQSLAGAVFTASLNSDPKQTWNSTPTDENGNCVIEDLPYGTYTVRETTIPDVAYNGEFYIDESTERSTTFEQFVEIDHTEREPYEWGDITDVAKKMQIKIRKIDSEKSETDPNDFTQGDAKLEGAEYTLYRDEACTDAIETVVVDKKDEEGYWYGLSGWYLVGKYWIKETKAPEGYLIDETVYSVEQIPAEQVEEHSSHYIISKDKVIEGVVRLIKYDNNSSSTQKLPAIGSKLRLSLNSNPDIYYDAVVDENGYLEFVDEQCRETCYPYTIPYGRYTISEIEASESRENIFIDKAYTEIRYEGQDQKYILSEDYINMRPTIKKIDEETKKPIPTGGTFKIWDVSRQRWYEERLYPSGEFISEFTTNEEGQLTINKHLEAGSYVIYETQAPYGYYLEDDMRIGAKGYEFTMGVGLNGDVIVYHDGQQQVLEYETEKYQNKPTKMYTYTAVAEDPPQKVIIHVKDIAEQFTKTEEEESEYGKVENPVFEEKGLEGVEFDIVAKEDVYTEDGTLRYRKGDVVDHIVTGEEGTDNTVELYLGAYDIVQTDVPDGYKKLEEPIEVNVEYSNQYERVQHVYVELKNDIVNTKLEFEKIFKELEISKFNFKEKKAVFGIYTDEVIKNYQGQNTIGKDELVKVMTTDDEGKVKSEIHLPEGRYYVKELYVSNPFEKTNDKYDFEVRYARDEDIELTVNEGQIENTAQIAELELLVYPEDKYDEYDIENETNRKKLEELAQKYGIEGKTYQIYNDEACQDPVITTDGEEVKYVTDENGKIYVPDIPTGTYYLKETIAPYGYDLSDEVIKAEIVAGRITILKAKEPLKKAKLLEKRDIFTKDIIAGCEFEITDKEGEVVYRGQTDDRGIIELPILYFENGETYYYQEISAPKMYQVNKLKQEFVAKYDENTCEWTLELIKVGNERKTIEQLILRKTDRETGERLQGCEFTIVLLDENGNEYVNEYGEKIYLVEKGLTNENGEYVINKVPYGTYKFVEIKAPEGYELDEDITGLEFTIDENSPDTVIFEVTNTGDIMVYTLSAILIISVFGIVYTIRKNKKFNTK